MMSHLRDKLLAIQRRYLPSNYTVLASIVLILKRVFSEFSNIKRTIMSDGEVSSETRRLGYKMCRDSIGGAWAETRETEFQIKKLGGGLTNYLYLCSLPSDKPVPDNQPSVVLLRVYGSIAKSANFVVQNSVVFALMSEKRLGPKLYGMNQQARIEEYIPTACLATHDIQNARVSRQIAHKLAQFHRLDMPLCKEPCFLNDTMDKWVIEVAESLWKNRCRKDQALVKKFKAYDLTAELTVLKNILAGVRSPVVFSHNDLQEGNILFMKDCENPEKQLTVIDWEYCSYNYRGHDFGNHFMEWCYDYSYPESPYYQYMPENYPSREQQYTFFRAYLEEAGEAVTDSALADMYVEANTHALTSHFFWGLWSILQNDMSSIQFGFMEYAECRLDGYYELKARLPTLTSDLETLDN